LVTAITLGLSSTTYTSEIYADPLAACDGDNQRECGRGPPKPPDIILIVVDTLRADYLSLYGYPFPQKHIEAFAKDSVVYSNALSIAPWTKPAMASMMTSMYPENHRVTNQRKKFRATEDGSRTMGILSSEASTLAEELGKSGYRTIALISNPWLYPRFGFGQGFDLFWIDESNLHEAPILIDQFKIIASKFDRDKPGFYYLHFLDVHGPYQCLEKDFKTIEVAEIHDAPTRIPDHQKALLLHMFKFRDRETARYQDARNCYSAGIQLFDRRFSTLIDYLKSANLYRDSLIVFTSDHGEELYEHAGVDHGLSLHSHQLQIPLIIHYPQNRHAGVRIDGLVSHLDVMPTLLKYSGAPSRDSHFEGMDITPPTNPEKKGAKREIFASADKGNRYKAITDGRYKLIIDRLDGKSSLFDLNDDPYEKKSLQSPEGKSIQSELETRLREHENTLREQRMLPIENTIVSRDIVEDLLSLGYLQ